MYNIVALSALCIAFLWVASSAVSHSLRGELHSAPFKLASKLNLEGNSAQPLSKQSDVVVGEYYSSGWWLGEVTQAGTCEQDDYLGENQVVNFEGYALNVCILQGGNRMKYQCDGGISCSHPVASYS